MKTIMKIGMLALLGTISLNNAFAQEHVGNGGGEDGVFKSIRNEISVWMKRSYQLNELDQKLELSDQSTINLYQRYSQAVKSVGERIVFNHHPILFNGGVKICKNNSKTKMITCNIDEWNAARGDTRYMIVFHEYLGIAGIETNVQLNYSSYPISPNILAFVHSQESFALRMEKNTQKQCSYVFNSLNHILDTENKTTVVLKDHSWINHYEQRPSTEYVISYDNTCTIEKRCYIGVSVMRVSDQSVVYRDQKFLDTPPMLGDGFVHSLDQLNLLMELEHGPEVLEMVKKIPNCSEL